MNRQSLITEKLVAWGKRNAEIRSLIVTGSRAVEGKSDEFSDYDIAVFLDDNTPFTSNDEWIEEVGQPWVCVHEKISWKEEFVPTRLVIFEPGVKIDFAFYSIKVLKELASNPLPDEFAAGYHVLLDKDGIASTMDPPSDNCYKQNPPTQKEFQRIIEEFWFEVYHVVKYLARSDLWSVKFRDHGIKQEFLLQMIRWHEQAKHQWNYSTHSQGKRAQDWVAEETWSRLQVCFARFDPEDCWLALNQTMKLFRDLSMQMAALLKFSYPQDLDDNITAFAKQVEKKQF